MNEQQKLEQLVTDSLQVVFPNVEVTAEFIAFKRYTVGIKSKSINMTVPVHVDYMGGKDSPFFSVSFGDNQDIIDETTLPMAILWHLDNSSAQSA